MKFEWPLMIRRVQGHSMVPVLPPGTIVFGWRWFFRLGQDKVIIFTRQNRETIKRIERIESDGLFVLGDHSETSTDSRQYGTIPKETVEAVVVWPRTHKVLAEDTNLSKQH
jgi:hypothetical protein